MGKRRKGRGLKRSIHLSPVATLAPLIGQGELVAFNVGHNGVAYLVVALKPLDDRLEQPGGWSSAKTVGDWPQTYRVIAVSGSEKVLDVTIESEPFNIHDIQPLPNELLLACARSSYNGPNDFEKNGRIYSRDGEFLREILLGDGLETVQATSKGVIWTSFSDEGVFGNHGWTDPVGASGLVAWSSDGNRVYDFQPRGGLDSIVDCYALNVVSDDDVWFYYYTDFALIRLHRREIDSVWKMPVRGSHAFAVSAGHALFQGGYDNQDNYLVFSLDSDSKPRLLAEIELRDTTGSKLVAERVVGRAGAIHLISGGFLYRVELKSILAEL